MEMLPQVGQMATVIAMGAIVLCLAGLVRLALR